MRSACKGSKKGIKKSSQDCTVRRIVVIFTYDPKTKRMKAFTLTLFDRQGDTMDSTTVYGADRKAAVENAKRLLLFQGLTRYSYKLKLKK